MAARFQAQIEAGEVVALRMSTGASSAPWQNVPPRQWRRALRLMLADEGELVKPKRFAFMLDGGVIVGRQSIPYGGDIPPGWVQVPRAAFDASKVDKYLPGTTLSAWRWTGSALERVADTRPVVTWGQTSVDVAQGDPSPSVTLTIDTGETGMRLIAFSGGDPVAVDFVGGVATVDVPTVNPGERTWNTAPEVRFANALTARIGALALQG